MVTRTLLGHMIIVALTVAACARQPKSGPGADDPIRPNGVTRSRAEIVRFMEAEVMPFARRTLEPVVGAGAVRCETCHGANPETRNWAMPAVAALPDANARGAAAIVGSDSQVRNALHGYAADPDKQRVASLMRREVLPGMAALLHRPVYDFTRPFAYNEERNAFGCYHCHMAQRSP